MLNVTTHDGEALRGSAEEVVAGLHRGAWLPEATDAEYMREVSRRVELFTGQRIRTDTAAAFLADLSAIGLLRLQLTH